MGKKLNDHLEKINCTIENLAGVKSSAAAVAILPAALVKETAFLFDYSAAFPRTKQRILNENPEALRGSP